MRTLLLLDGNNLANIAFNTVGHLTGVGDVAMGVWFGVCETLHLLANEEATNDIVWFFHGGHTARSAIWPGYKEDRKVRTDEERALKAELYRQIDVMAPGLVGGLLHQVGFENVHRWAGVEADDLIGQMVLDEPTTHDRYMIVSTDKDYWQLLMPHVVVYNPITKVTMTDTMFREKYNGLDPQRWAAMKAIIGGKENIPGAAGVGEVYALKFLQGQLGAHTKAHATIVAHKAQAAINYKLAVIPIAGTPSVGYTANTLTPAKWRDVCMELGFEDMCGRPPMCGGGPKRHYHLGRDSVAKKRKKGRNPGAKGGQFERDFATDLSEWLTHGVRDDVFWRTQGSGGRATQRQKRGATTQGQYGDICATDADWAFVDQAVTVELKRGYTTANIHPLLDAPEHRLPGEYEKFMDQAILSHEQALSAAWWLVTKRDGCHPVFALASRLARAIAVEQPGCWARFPVSTKSTFAIRRKTHARTDCVNALLCRGTDFWEIIKPASFTAACRGLAEGMSER